MARTISVTSAGITLTSGNNPVSVTSSGSISGSTTGDGIYGPGGTGATWTIDNAGYVGSTNFDGIQLGASLGSNAVAPALVINQGSGVISGQYGVYIYGSGSVTNQSGGLITGNTFAA